MQRDDRSVRRGGSGGVAERAARRLSRGEAFARRYVSRSGGGLVALHRRPERRIGPGGGLANCVSCDEVSYAAWTHDSKRLAYVASDGLHVVQADGSGDRLIDASGSSPAWDRRGKTLLYVRKFLQFRRNGKTTTAFSKCRAVSWSADGHWLACSTSTGFPPVDVTLLDSRGRYRADLGISSTWPVWSPTGANLALGGDKTSRVALRVVDARTLRVRTLIQDEAVALAWSPRGDRLAYNRGFVVIRAVETGDLRVVKLDGSSRTLLRASEPYGSTITSIAWTQGAGDPRWPQAAAQDGVHGSGQVTDLATSGSDVAYVACGRA